jgi:hypothetical protein
MKGVLSCKASYDHYHHRHTGSLRARTQRTLFIKLLTQSMTYPQRCFTQSLMSVARRKTNLNPIQSSAICNFPKNFRIYTTENTHNYLLITQIPLFYRCGYIFQLYVEVSPVDLWHENQKSQPEHLKHEINIQPPRKPWLHTADLCNIQDGPSFLDKLYSSNKTITPILKRHNSSTGKINLNFH